MKNFIILPVLLLMLTSFTSTPNSLDQILEENKGKVVFVDFWASWCKPCREEMRKMPEIKKKFKGKDVVFVYFSQDIDDAEWREACKKEGIENEKYSFMTFQLKKSIVLKGHRVNEMPRYMIFNKKGELANAFAPHPGKELEKEFEKYLAE